MSKDAQLGPPSHVSPTDADAAERVSAPTLRGIAAYFVRLGTFGFGGPIALAAAMHRDLVGGRRWVSEADYAEGLAFAQLCPGPLAAQLAMYLGWLRARALGATLVALAFVGPSFLMVLALAALYVRGGGLWWMQGVFYGIRAAVVAVLVRGAVRLVSRSLARDWLLWGIFLGSGVVTTLTESEIVWVFLLGGAIVLLIRGTPFTGGGGVAAALSPDAGLWLALLGGGADLPALGTIFLFFARAGAFVFGSGLAIVPFLHAGVVEEFRWLTENQFLDAVAVAMITPGPVIITAAFIGYLVAGLLGSLAATVGVFLPCYLFVVLLAPFYRRYARNRHVRAFVQGVTAAAVGAIAGAAWILGRQAITDLTTAGIAVAAGAVLLFAKKVPEPLVILAAGAVGVALKP